MPKKMINKVPVWKSTSWAERLWDCRVALAVNGLLSDAESAKVKKRWLKMFSHLYANEDKDKKGNIK